jgi:hypothetical protein
MSTEADDVCTCGHARKFHGNLKRGAETDCHSGLRPCAEGCKAFEDCRLDRLPAERQVDIANGGHMWLNGFSCIRPTDEFLIGIGRAILANLEQTKYRDGLGISKMIILTVNKS